MCLPDWSGTSRRRAAASWPSARRPAQPGRAARVIAPDAVAQETRGAGTNTRHVRNILPDTADIAENLLVVEVITPGGHWSSYPPHKHDTDDPPHETYLEETYYHRLARSAGFALQRVYTDDGSLDQTMAVRDRDVVLVPSGYHPVGAPHGFDLYYLNVMAGPVKQWRFTMSPEHDFLPGESDSLHGKLVQHFIGGRRSAGEGARRADVFDPATGQVARQVVLGTRADIDAAVAASRAAFPGWAATTPLSRARVMFRFRDLLEQHTKQIAAIITAEHGKVLSDAMGEVTRGMEVVEYATAAPELLKGDFTEQAGRNIDAFSLRQPLGVCAGITPFNFPAMVPLWMLPMALACGNCFILKPSERDPSASLLLADLLQRAGLPDGVFNVVHGDKEAVDAILEHPGIEAVSFVGSTPIAGTSIGPAPRTASGCRRWAVRRTMPSSCRTPTWKRPRMR